MNPYSYFFILFFNAKIKGIKKTHIRMPTNKFRWTNGISLFGNYRNNHSRQKSSTDIK